MANISNGMRPIHLGEVLRGEFLQPMGLQTDFDMATARVSLSDAPMVNLSFVPWQPQPIMCGPFLFPLGQWRDRQFRNQARARRRALPNLQTARFVYGVVPNFRQVRAALMDAVRGMDEVGNVVVNDVMVCWGLQPDSGVCIVDLTQPLPAGSPREGTTQFLNEMRRRMVRYIQQARAISVANGGWWPAPECMQLLLHPDKSISARMRFATGYQPPGQTWLEFSDSGGGWLRRFDHDL